MNLKQLIYPPRCPFCGKIMVEEGPCEPCMKQATELTALICRTCGADPEHCGCGGRSFAFHRNVSAFLYERSPRRLVLRFKERKKPQLAEFMANRMYHHVFARLGTDFSVITFVPQTRWKNFSRGYSPARLLAERLSERMDVPCVEVLQRVKGRQQKNAKASERWENAKCSYKLQNDAQVHGRVLLVDEIGRAHV